MKRYMHIMLKGVVLFISTIAFAIAQKADTFDPSSSAHSFETFTNDSLLWAPYRSNCYFGIRPRYLNDHPFLLGAMWFDTTHSRSLSNMRHFVSQDDRLEKYGWESYDPRIGGKEVIIDKENNVNLTFYFVKSKDGQNWGVRVHGEPLDTERLSATSLIFYLNQNGKDGHLTALNVENYDHKHIKLNGIAPELDEYDISIDDVLGEYYSRGHVLAPDADSSKTSHVSITVPDDQVWKAKDIFQTLLGDSVQDLLAKNDKLDPSSLPSAFTLRNIHGFPPGNFHFIQKTFDTRTPFEFDVIFSKKTSKQRIHSSEMSNLIARTLDEIRTRFEKKFSIDEKYKKFAHETLSNLLGGIGYFHGTQMVDRTTQFDEEQFEKIDLKHPEEEGPLDLFSCVPSRAFFPRGFYWDEGFHLLQVMEYDFDLVLEILQSWFQLIEDNSGWIARELILGDEARSKVPEEFQVQNPNIANPPTLLLAFSEMLTKALEYQEMNTDKEEVEGLESLSYGTEELKKRPELLLSYAKKVYPKLLKHYDWFRNTQKGMVEEYLDSVDENVHEEEAYRWIGRTFTHCLPSGLDDYPRSQPPDVAELHVDALAWVGVMTRSLKQIAQVLGIDEDVSRFNEIENNIVENLDILHWSEKDHCYCDLTINDESDDDVRDFVCHEGYISLLPFALKLLPRDSPNLKYIVELMSDSEKLFSDFGLLSLSKKDEFYETGEVYWRAPVWININYLCLDALEYYFRGSTAEVDHDTVRLAKTLYHDLRQNLISNVHRVWTQDGYCYENYNHRTGNGSGVQHFTGWTSLVVNIMGRLPESL